MFKAFRTLVGMGTGWGTGKEVASDSPDATYGPRPQGFRPTTVK